MNTANTKGALRSKAVWGAIFTLVGSFGLLPLGMQFDPETGNLTLNIYNVAGAIGAIAVPGGGLLALVGRIVGKKFIRGLW